MILGTYTEMGVIPETCMIDKCDTEQNTHTCIESLIHLCDTEMGVIYVIWIGIVATYIHFKFI